MKKCSPQSYSSAKLLRFRILEQGSKIENNTDNGGDSLRYAIISDIHGNLIAFQAVLKDIYYNQIDKIILLGDYCIDFPWANEVVNLIRSFDNTYVIRGNKEDYFINMEKEDPSSWNCEQLGAIYWNYRELALSNREYLKSLPERLDISDGDNKIYLAHMPEMFFGKIFADTLTGADYPFIVSAYPGISHQDYLRYANKIIKNDRKLTDRLNRLPDGIYLFGHYHTQWYAEISGKLLINPGSCGLPMDNDNRASYTILDCNGPKCTVEEHRISYDVELTINLLKNSGLYKAAEIWSKINILHLKTGRQYINDFLQYVENVSRERGEETRPYSNELWKSSAEKWFLKQDKHLWI